MIVFLFLIGLFVGSFLNVLIDRIPRGETFVKGRSHCDYCHHVLRWYDLIPLVSFLSLRGKCRYCKKCIGWKYPIIELTTGLLFSLPFFTIPTISLGNSLYQASNSKYWETVLYYLCITSCFIVIFFTDLFYGIIPDIIILPASIITFLYIISSSFHSLPYFLLSALGACFFFLFLFAVTKGRGMGFGDVKLAFLLGLVLGWPKIFLSIYLAFLTGACVAFILIVWKKKKFHGGTIPFGPFLILGTIICLFWGDFILGLLLYNFLL